MINLIYITHSVSSKNTGVSFVIRSLYDTFSKDNDFNLEIMTTENDGTIFLKNDDNIHIFPCFQHWRYAPQLTGFLKNRQYQSNTLMHIHGVWLYPQYIAAKIALKKKVPYIITTHGMLSPWHLKRKWWKLYPYLRLIEHRNLKDANCIHALTENEKNYLKQLIPSLKRIEVIPNGIDPKILSDTPDVNGLLEKFPQIRGRSIILFLGRLYFVKSIQELIEAWAQIAEKEKEHILLIVGPDQVGLQTKLMKRIKQKKIEDRVIFTGFLTGRLKLAAYHLAKIFVSPSKTEVIGLTNLEAMWMKIPILITKETGLRDIEQYGAGKFTLPTVESIAENLDKMMKMPDDELKQMGEQGRKMVEEKYILEKTVPQMKELYRSVLI